MENAMDSTLVHEEWDQFFQLENPDTLLDAVPTKELAAGVATKDFYSSSSPSIPSLDFLSNSTGNSSPSEAENFAAQFSPVYQLPAPMASPTGTNGQGTKKRKTTTDGDAVSTTTRQPRGQKISHNVIEKRYRSNLNDKIAKLRDSVPELRTATPTVKRRPKAPGTDSDGSGDEAAGLKFNKATVLTKATEYIQQLERQNQKLVSELSVLRNRAGPVEKLRNPPAISTSVMVESTTPEVMKAPSTAPSTIGNENGSPTETMDTSPGLIRVPSEVQRLRDEAQSGQHYASSLPGFKLDPDQLDDPFNQPVQGMIPVPESFRRLREEAAAQDHFAPESSYYTTLEPDDILMEEEEGEGSNWPRSKTLSRVLVGSLAGLMVMEGFNEQEADVAGNEQRGLFALPSELLTESRGFRAQIRRRIIDFARSTGPQRALPFMICLATFLILCLAAFFYLAPRRLKHVTESAREAEHRANRAASVSAPQDQPGRSTSHRTYSPPPDAMLETEPTSWDLRFIDRLTMEWFGLSLPANAVDEEAARRAVTPRRDLAALRTIMQSLFLQRSSSPYH